MRCSQESIDVYPRGDNAQRRLFLMLCAAQQTDFDELATLVAEALHRRHRVLAQADRASAPGRGR